MGCAIVTGAAGAIGQALVRRLADAGRLVIGVDIAAKPKQLPAKNYVQCDLARTVSDPDYAEESFAAIRTKFNGNSLNVLVNNAAVQVLGKLEDLSRDTWRRTLDVNLLAPFFWAQAFLPELELAKGSVLNISSVHAQLTKPQFIAYATSKAALSSMTRTMAVEVGSRVRVNAIEPGAIETPMLREGFSRNPDALRTLANYHPAKMIGTPEQLADFVVAIIKVQSQFLNGSTISFDGGISGCLHDPI